MKETHLTLIERNVSEAVDFVGRKTEHKKNLRTKVQEGKLSALQLISVVVNVIISRGFIDFHAIIILSSIMINKCLRSSPTTLMSTRYPFHDRFYHC